MDGSTIKFPSQCDYPKSIRICDVTYSVDFDKNLDCFGITDSEHRTLTIKAGLPPRAMLSTFIHEMLHVIEFERPLKIKHKDVYALEAAILDILMDNFL